MNELAAFAVFAAILTITPGLDTLLVLRTTAASGRAAGLGAVIGIGLGCLVWAVASAVGVTALLAASRVAFEVLRWAGVAYLVWLGLRSLWYARRPVADPVSRQEGLRSGAFWPGRTPSRHEGFRHGGGFGSALRMGFTTNLLNPKVGVFYLSVLPLFLPAGINPLAGSVLLGTIHVGEGLIWLGLLVVAVNLARTWLTRPAAKQRLEQLAGVAFLAFGLKLALDRAP